MKKMIVTVWLAFVVALGTCQIARANDTQSPPIASDKKSAPQLVEVSEAEKLIAAKKAIVLDVRMPAEFATGHIAGATNIDIYNREFKTRLEQMDKNQPYLVHCAVGMRSAKACTVMTGMGFKSVYDLKGGMTAWEKAGKPVVK